MRSDSQNQSSAESSLNLAQNEIVRLQTELHHQHIRYDDLKNAYSSLERSIGNTLDPTSHKIMGGARTNNSTPFPNEIGRRYEVTVEGGIATATPAKVAANTAEEVTHLINDRTIQLNLFKVI